jgi:hypothetical protein
MTSKIIFNASLNGYDVAQRLKSLKYQTDGWQVDSSILTY